jgi:MFS family permease
VALPSLRELIDELLKLHMALAFFFGLGTGVVFAFMPTYAEALGVRSLALFYTGYAGSAMFVRIGGGRLIDTLGRRAVIVPSMLVQACAAAILAIVAIAAELGTPVPALPFLCLAGIIAGGGHGFLYPALAALVTDVTSDVRRSAVVGLFSSVFLTGNALGTFAFGFVAHGLGYGAMWAILTAILVAGFLLSVKLVAAPHPVIAEVTSR